MFFEELTNMGITLSQPITTKETFLIEDQSFKVGVSSMQGWRVTMEDAHAVYLHLPEDNNASFFAVYDGHSGAKISGYLGENLHHFIVKQDAYLKGNVKDALQNAFLEIDGHMKDLKELADDMSGSTAVTVLIKSGTLYCANLGDSRAIAVVGGSVVPLSEDHKPNSPTEYERILEAGGWVEYNRVNGNLAVSRAFGDYVYKMNEKKEPEKQAITALPDVVVKQLKNDWDFIVLACDGIWDVMTNQEVADFVKSKMQEHMKPDAICEELMNKCLSPVNNYGGIGCDNMTVIIVVLMNNKNNVELYKSSESQEKSVERSPTKTERSPKSNS